MVQGNAGVMCVCVGGGIVLSQQEVLFCPEQTQEREGRRGEDGTAKETGLNEATDVLSDHIGGESVYS